MKKKMFLAILAIIMIVFIVITTYFWYHLFLDLGSNGKLGGLQNVKSSLILTDINNTHIIYDEKIDNISKVEGYRFRVENKGISTQNYRLILKELSADKVNDGCTNATLIDKSMLNYQLYVNGTLTHEGDLDDILKAYLHKGTINIESIDNYELKVWLKKDYVNDKSRHYHYVVELEVIK